MRLIAPPGVFSPRSDSHLLADLIAQRVKPGDRMLDPFCGSGILALAAAGSGARATAVDISRRAVLTTRLNALLNGLRVRTVRSADLSPLSGERFDLIAANPPYLPGDIETASGVERAWEGGPDGRTFIDRLCAEAPRLLFPGGALLLIQSSVCGESETLDAMTAAGLEDARVIERRRGPVGPLLAAKGRKWAPDGTEEILVIEGRSPGRAPGPQELAASSAER